MWITFFVFVFINIISWRKKDLEIEIESSFPHCVENNLSTRNVNEVYSYIYTLKLAFLVGG